MANFFIVVALIFVGFGLVWLSKLIKLELGEASKTTVILAPLIVFLFLSGKISEFEGLGWKAKFRSLGAESVVKAARTSDLATISDQTDPADFFNEAFWTRCRPYYVLTENSAKKKDKPNELDKRAAIQIATAIRSSIICGRFIALVILDKDRKPLGFFPRAHFLEILRTILVAYGPVQLDSEAAFMQIASSELGVILMHPEARAKSDEANHNTVLAGEDIESVYKKMIAANVDTALITDRLGRFDGIITRAAIEAKIIEGLLTASK